MSKLYTLFQELAKSDDPLHCKTYIELTVSQPELATKLERLLRHIERPLDDLTDRIYDEIMLSDNPISRLGRTIDNKYKIVELLGQGGMSDVYKATRSDGLIEHSVAVKYFSLAHSSDDALDMVTKEAQILATLDHHLIATFLDIGHDDHQEPNIMMEYIEGQTLFAFLRNENNPQALEKVHKTLNEAKDYLKRKGIVHGDINHNNVLVDNNGCANIIDFDIATYAELTSG
ncbi:serine/threonine protein kinase [Agaribacter marinus]|uniref:Protein kinase domain-containing protein n=1 Tax=Agaribacter marinus TaxID=1431249 RepID=A0AA37SW37_9ALTE|nr:protein kinase [Agaribacter marinus]GLR69444.1 hypothetical protein GCM10007852_03520 [Agaribacter marinus]